MSYRLLTVCLVVASAVLATQSIAQMIAPPGLAGANSGERMGGGGGQGAAATTTVKSSKSNTSDRMGGGGGGKGATQLNPQPEPPGRSGKK